MSCEVHVGDIGTVFRVTVQDCNANAVDISAASEKTITFKKPDGSTLVKSAGFVTNGSDGLLQYVAISGDIDAVGAWKIQTHVTTPSGSWSSDFHTFKVSRNL